jgi:hypothetical protein
MQRTIPLVVAVSRWCRSQTWPEHPKHILVATMANGLSWGPHGWGSRPWRQAEEDCRVAGLLNSRPSPLRLASGPVQSASGFVTERSQ